MITFFRKLLIISLMLFSPSVIAEKTILVIGDSLSAGYGLSPSKGWVNLLKRIQQHASQYRVINSSISGETTGNGLSRLPKALKEYKPAITIIQLGANDGLRGFGISLIRKNLEKMVVLAKGANSKVLLLGMRLPLEYSGLYSNRFHQIYLDERSAMK